MPAVWQQKDASKHILVWKTDEELDFFTQNTSLSFEEKQEFSLISHELRRKEWLAARYALKQICNVSIFKDSFGKPQVENQQGYISISHCKSYAAAIFSSSHWVGIDIEPIHDKVQRIASKFLNPQELAFMSQEYFTEHLIAAWSVKEAVYKFYGKKNLSFQSHILLESFDWNAQEVKVKMDEPNFKGYFTVNLHKIDGLIIAYL
jgi:4'-phosphopantetheinyl transferase